MALERHGCTPPAPTWPEAQPCPPAARVDMVRSHMGGPRSGHPQVPTQRGGREVLGQMPPCPGESEGRTENRVIWQRNQGVLQLNRARIEQIARSR